MAPWLLAMVTLGAWALSSPAGSSPDDNYHLPSIWCAAGTDGQRCADIDGNPEARSVPDEVAGAPCFAFDPTISGDCQAPFAKTTGPTAGTDRGNWSHGYPPGFYRVMHLFVGDSLAASVLMMRLFNSVLLLTVLAALTVLVPRRLRSIPALTVLVTSVPLGLSVYPSTNPSSWAITSAATVWIAFYAALETTGRRRLGLTTVGVLGAALAASSRSDQALFTVFTLGLVLVARVDVVLGPAGERLGRLRGQAVVLVGMALAVVFSLLGFLSAGVSSAVTDGLGVEGLDLSWWDLLRQNALGLPTVWFGSFGYGDQGVIGWLDTRFPPVVGFGALFTWVVVMWAQWRGIPRARGVAMLALVAAMIVYPLYLLAISKSLVGTQFQPRYLLPLLMVLTGLSLLGEQRWTRFGSAQRCALVVALSVAQCFALFSQIRRYVTGVDVAGFNLSEDPQWWWPVGWPLSPNGVWVLGSVAFTVLTWELLGRRREREHGSS